MTIVEFLKARLDDDERGARMATEGGWAIWRDLHHQGYITVGDQAGVLEGDQTIAEHCNPVAHVYTQEDADHIARHDPARVLREVEAKRQMLDVYHAQGTLPDGTLLEECTTCGGANEAWPCPTLRLLALPYAGHEDYREEWGHGV